MDGAGKGWGFRARDLRLKREVAIKILPEEFLRDPGRVARFRREAELVASLNDRNIAAIYYCGSGAGAGAGAGAGGGGAGGSGGGSDGRLIPGSA